ncbi:hypothetical protein HDE_00310 [Halotydeus destructor]|nr:hypothetical protein HDE_00310 [Halotydeus destructor]
MGPNGVSQSSSAKVIRVPISTFPPTAMVYSINKVQQQPSASYATETAPKQADYVSAAIMAKVLEERTKERNMKNTDRIQKCAACRSKRSTVPYYDQGTQTPIGTLTEDDFLTHPFDLTNGQDFYERTFTISRDLSMDDSSVNQHSLSGLSPWPASFAISMPSHQQTTRNGTQTGNGYSFKDQLSEDSHTYSGLTSKKSETMII